MKNLKTKKMDATSSVEVRRADKNNLAIMSSILFFSVTGIAQNTSYNKNDVPINGIHCSAFGFEALKSNISGNYNTANGRSALYANTTGSFNTATAVDALRYNTTGNYNTADGIYALYSNTTGDFNTAIGLQSLFSNITGSFNTAVGYNAGPIVGGLANTTALGNGAIPTANNTLILGNSSVTSICASVPLTILSDRRFKNNIQENVPGLEFINQLKPITYNYKIHELNNFIGGKKAGDEQDKVAERLNEPAIAAKEKIVYSGFVAQEVEKAANKASYNFSGVHKPENDTDPYGLSYADFVVPLVKAVQELSVKNEEKKSEIKQLNEKLKNLENKLDTLINSHSGTTNLELDSKTIVLDQNAPNPFAESTTISYSIDENFNSASITILDSRGSVIKTVPIITKGKNELKVYGNNLSSGVYQYSLIVDGKVISTKSFVKE